MSHPEIEDTSSDQSVLRLRTVVPAPPSRVFAHFTEPNLLTLWWPEEARLDARTGGDLELSWPAMNWTLRGRYLEFAPERLRFTWRWEHEPDLPERTVTVEFEGVEEDQAASASGHELGHCQLTVSHGTYEDSDRDQEDRSGHDAGWRHFLGRLFETLQTRA